MLPSSAHTQIADGQCRRPRPPCVMSSSTNLAKTIRRGSTCRRGRHAQDPRRRCSCCLSGIHRKTSCANPRGSSSVAPNALAFTPTRPFCRISTEYPSARERAQTITCIDASHILPSSPSHRPVAPGHISAIAPPCACGPAYVMVNFDCARCNVGTTLILGSAGERSLLSYETPAQPRACAGRQDRGNKKHIEHQSPQGRPGDLCD